MPRSKLATGAVAVISLLIGVAATGEWPAAPMSPAGADPTPAWFVTPSPNSGLPDNVLQGTSCTSPTSCVAVGYAWSEQADEPQTLVETANGTTWAVSPSPNVLSSNVLEAVSCTSSTSCMAVGSAWNGATQANQQTLIEQWDGSSWSIVPSPSPDPADVLNGVSCTSTSDCVAVGYSEANSTSQTLIEMWDGSTWSVSPSPDPGTDDGLSGVSCTSPSNCVAVGYSEADSAYHTLIETWDGTGWGVTPSPDPNGSGTATSPFLQGVSCLTTTDCVAVGWYNYGAFAEETLVEMWDGTSWSLSDSPSPLTLSDLFGVSCTSPDYCVATGTATTGQPGSLGGALVETWDGNSWSVTSTEATPNVSTNLSGISCTDPSDCVATGAVAPLGGGLQTFILTESTLLGSSTTVQVAPASVQVGTPVTYSASVTSASGTPTGDVTFSIGIQTLCTATLTGGSATCSSSGAPIGSDTVTATYGGDATSFPSSGTTALTVTPILTTTTVSASPTMVLTGSPVLYAADVTSDTGSPSGTVSFSAAGIPLCTATVSANTASCSASNAPVGNDTVVADFSGSSPYGGSSGYTSLLVVGLVSSVTCSRLSGHDSTSVAFSRCTPFSKVDKKATGAASVLTSGGTLTWSRSGLETTLVVTTTSPGQGLCRKGQSEFDVTGAVTGLNSAYTHAGDPVAFRFCETKSGSVKLLAGTTAGL